MTLIFKTAEFDEIANFINLKNLNLKNLEVNKN